MNATSSMNELLQDRVDSQPDQAELTYRFGPFAMQSELPLPELSLTARTGIPVSISLGPGPESVETPIFSTAVCSASRNEFRLSIPGVAKFHSRNGSEVWVQPEAGSDPLDVRGYLLGNIFAVLCHQRRLLPLHAGSVRMGGGAVAFLGDSGAGKSTLAAFLVARGFRLVADDVCLIDPDASAVERVIPVASWLKLWRTSLEALGRGEIGLTRTFSDEDKYRVLMQGDAKDAVAGSQDAVAGSQEDRLPLKAIVILGRQPENTPRTDDPLNTLQPLRPAQAVVEAMRFTYQHYLLDWLGLKEEHFLRTSLGIADAPVFVCHRTWGFARLTQFADQLEQAFGGPD